MRKTILTLMCLVAMMAAGVGLKAQEITITLDSGWNWISYPNAVAMEVDEALATFAPMEGDVVKGAYGFSVYHQGRWVGGLTHFMPGRGYMYYSTRSEVTSFVFAQPFSSVVATATPTDITAVSAVVGGVVMLSEGSHVYLRGVCWGTESNLDIDGSHTYDGTGIGMFTSTIEGLASGTTYYVRAYAVSDYGLAYGDVMSFTTLSGIPNPEVSTAEVTDITATSATTGGTVVADENLAIIARGVCWSTSSSPTISDSHTNDGTGTGSFVSTLTGLTSNITYYVRAYATTAQATTYGEELSFTTSDGVVVTTSEPMLITAISAMGGGEVTVSDGTYILVKGLCWAVHENPTTNDDFFEEAESGVGSFSISMTDLNIGTTYYVRAYAVTPNGTVYGDQKTFTTRDGIPEVSTDSVMRILASFATCNGTVTDNGGLDVIARGVCWSTIHNPTIYDDHSINGLGLGSFSGEISGLSPSTTYYVRAYASTSYSTGYGEEMSFTTQGSSAGQYVDLGLPTGTLWALCNAGAEAPEEYGGYYDEGSVPNLDADWRLPTKEEWQELLNNTTSIWTIQNDVNGRLYTASNGNSLFLPAAGYIWLSGSGTLEGVGLVGYYWSISFVWDDLDNMYRRWYFCYNGYNGSDNFNYLYGDIIYLMSVRAVHRKPCVVNVTANPIEGGVVSGGGTYLDGTNCTVSATANEGYTFTNWTENDEVVSTEATYSFTLDENKTLVANFTYVGGGDHTYVDLGLPSGTLWATCNVGADSPSDYGDYFAWGETQLKETYDWSTYQYCMGSYNTLTKYCYNPEYGYNGFTDNLTILLPEDDAATVNWGTDWRIPTNEEWQELYQNTTYTWATLNSITGILFTASNGNSLFLPLAGIREGSSLNYLGNVGRYLSSFLGTYRPYGAWLFYFDNVDEVYGNQMWDPNRHHGNSVRAVRSGSQSNTPSGAINGKFTINADGEQVYFSQGNLQYQASTNTWRFAENQYDYVGSDNSNISSAYSGWIDLFGWGTSGYNHGANCYQPWSTSQTNSDYYAYGSYTYNLYDQTGQADWGYNSISNGGNQTSQWRTLTQPEWNYVFNTRATIYGIRYAKANVNNVNGIILLPDDWNTSTYSLYNTNSSSANFNSNTLTASQWSTLEQAGAVFLPAAGYMVGTSVDYVGSQGRYWSASWYKSYNAYGVYFNSSGLNSSSSDSRYLGRSVRLVHVAE